MLTLHYKSAVSVSAAVYEVLTRKAAKYQAKTRTWLKNIMFCLIWGPQGRANDRHNFCAALEHCLG